LQSGAAGNWQPPQAIMAYVRKMEILAYSFTFLVKFTRENERFLSKKFVDVRSSEHAVSHSQQLAMD